MGIGGEPLELLPEVMGTAPTRIAIGCGVNIAHAPKGTPYPVTMLGAAITIESVLQDLDLNLSNRLKIWDEGRDFAAIRKAWETNALGIGGEVSARAGTSEIRGIFKGLAADGALVIRLPDGAEHSIHAGDVSFAELERLRNPTP